MQNQGSFALISGSLLLVLLMGCTAPAARDKQDYAYLIIKSTTLQQDQDQPDWIALCRHSSKCFRYNASGPILKIDPGGYSIGHIDYEENWKAGGSAQYLDTERFQFEAGVIYFYGHIQFDLSRSWIGRSRSGIGFPLTRQYEPKLLMDAELVREACASDPEVFERYPVVNIHNGDKVKLSCNSEND